MHTLHVYTVMHVERNIGGMRQVNPLDGSSVILPTRPAVYTVDLGLVINHYVHAHTVFYVAVHAFVFCFSLF